jgi:hypothetical protein
MTPRSSRRDLLEESDQERYRHAVAVTFNIGNQPETKEKKLQARREWLENQAPGPLRVSKSTSWRYFIDAVDQIVEHLTSLDHVPVIDEQIASPQAEAHNPEAGSGNDDAAYKNFNPAASADRHQSSEENTQTIYRGFIRREKYHKKFARMIDMGAKLVVISGLPGIGKTTFAETLIADLLKDDGSIAIKIKLSKDKVNRHDMRHALRTIGLSAEPADIWRSPEQYMSDLLCGPNAASFVVFDGLNSLSEIERLLPTGETKSTVIVCCRVLSPLSRPHEVIRVGPMGYAESLELIRRRLPDHTSDQHRLLARSFGGYPGLIDHGCTLLAHAYVSADRFCEDISADVGAVAGHVGTDEGKKLYVVIKGLLKLAVKEHRLARPLLTCLAAVEDASEVNTEFVLDYLREYCDQELTHTALAQVLEVIERYSLLEIWIESVAWMTEALNAVKHLPSTTARPTLRLAGRRAAARINNIVHGILRQLLAEEIDAASVYAARVYEKAQMLLGDMAEQHGLDSVDIVAEFRESVSADTASSANDHYDNILTLQSFASSVAVSRHIEDAQKSVNRAAGHRMGSLMLSLYHPYADPRVADLEDKRPHDGSKVRLLDHEFALIQLHDAVMFRYAFELQSMMNDKATPMIIMRSPSYDPQETTMSLFRGTHILLTDVP